MSYAITLGLNKSYNGKEGKIDVRGGKTLLIPSGGPDGGFDLISLVVHTRTLEAFYKRFNPCGKNGVMSKESMKIPEEWKGEKPEYISNEIREKYKDFFSGFDIELF